ncbi:AAA family ATPase [Actinoplanes sp. TFC3]|uniref:AAA family ATPase n=1 Tax=Actinoplanes sp. TFC3 TaxID=1710355 RepID=UPI00083447C3|nr:AAA family ATPase [Actinoplanes sp. TFC3]
MTEPESFLPRFAERLRDGRCVLVIGDGVAQAVGAPTLRDVLIEHGSALLPADLQLRPGTISAMRLVDLDALAALAVAESGNDRVSRAIYQTLHRRRADYVSQRPQWLTDLVRLPFAAIISFAWDDSIERLVERPPWIMLPGKPLPHRSVLSGDSTIIMKPLGDYQSPRSLMPSLAEYEGRYGRDSEFGQFLSSALATNSAFIVGVNAGTVADLFGGAEVSYADHAHYALLEDSSPIDIRLLRSRYNVREPLAEEGGTWRTRLVSLLRELPRLRTARSPARSHRRLRHLELHNIGPFTSLKVPISDEWTVLLGDNGAGKSTLLRAMALVLCGQSVTPEEANDLLSVGSSSGLIELVIGDTTYRTELVRERTRVRVKAATPTPVEVGELLALGFPAVRGISKKAPRGPREERVLGIGHPSDLEALRRGDTDTRLDDLQQWLVNLAVVAQGISLGDSEAARRRLESVFELWRSLTPGMPIHYAGLDSDSWDVLVRFGDSTVPLRTLSQGTLSTVSWVGTVLRRLIDRFDEPVERLTQRHALVIVDELDAHLHPEWQRLIVPTLRRLLPEVQVIATTHSPLIVGALNVGEVLTIHRDEAGMGSVQPSQELRGWRADQILTSPAFGLGTSRDTRVEQNLEDYEKALADPAASPSRVAELAEQLSRDIPRHEETATQRRAAELVDATLLGALRGLPEDARTNLMQQADEYLREVNGDEG